MALQPNRHSRMRRNKSRTHQKFVPLKTVVCANCKQAILPHRVCPSCGYYKGRQVIQAKVG